MTKVWQTLLGTVVLVGGAYLALMFFYNVGALLIPNHAEAAIRKADRTFEFKSLATLVGFIASVILAIFGVFFSVIAHAIGEAISEKFDVADTTERLKAKLNKRRFNRKNKPDRLF